MPTTTCPSCYQNQCPEVPGITIVEAPTVALGGAEVQCKNESFSVAAGNITNSGDGLRYLILAAAPLDGTALLFRNGTSQRLDTYTLYGNVLRLNTAAETDDLFQVQYWTYAGATGSESTWPLTGSFMQMNDTVTTLPGYILCDGSTAYVKATYPTLWVYLSAHTDMLQASTATTFTLKNMSFLVQQGESVVTMNTFIKT